MHGREEARPPPDQEAHRPPESLPKEGIHPERQGVSAPPLAPRWCAERGQKTQLKKPPGANVD